jgi:soluble lytic murein transglycosylase-like protein
MEPYYTKMGKCFHLAIAAITAAAALQGGTAVAPAGKVATVVRSDPRTGRLVRKVVVTPPAARPRARAGKTAPLPASFNQTVERIAYEHALPVQLMHSIIKVESNYDPYAVSPKGALGLMQLIPATAKRFGVKDVFDPVENLRGGARYLRYLLDLYGDYPLALAAYNAGEGAVARYGGVPPYAETQEYLVKVKRALEESRRKAGLESAAVAPRHESGEAEGERYNKIYEVVGPDGRVRYVSR